MAPKKKDKSKTADWLQCRLCGKLIIPADAEIHSMNCDADHSFIHGKRFSGKVTKAEDLSDGEKNSVTKGVKDKDSTVWLSVSVMNLCEIAIGQQVVINGHVVKKAWPLTCGQVTNIGLSKSSLEEMSIKDGTRVTVHKLCSKSHLVESAVLKLMDSNEIFEKGEFCTYVSSYLDKAFLTMNTPLRIKYFGQVCQCRVKDIHLVAPAVPTSDSKIHSSSLSDSFLSVQSTQNNPDSVFATPVKSLMDNSSFNLENVTDLLEQSDLSSSFSTLNIGEFTSPMVQSSTPRTGAKQDFPTLGTPSVDSHRNSLHDMEEEVEGLKFGRVVSGMTRVSIEPVNAVIKNNKEHNSVVAFSLDNVGGMNEKIEELKQRISRAQQPGSLSQCILIHGAPGTGKTLLVRAVVGSLAVHAVYVAGTDIWSKLFGEAETKLRNIFKSAADRSPSVVVIDDMDVICPKRSQQAAGQQEHRIVGTLLSLVDSAHVKKSDTSSIVVIGITNKPDDLDPALRRSGRFGCEIEIQVPNPTQRYEILNSMMKRVPHELTMEDVDSVARKAHGYVGADLTALINEASVHALTRQPGTGQCHDVIASIPLTAEDLVYAGQLVKPSALREIQLEVPEVRWSDIGGMYEVKMRLREAVELPLSHPSLYHNMGIEPPRGLLMYGPPGCSKTMIARAVATECKLNFLAVKGPELFNQFVGESEKAIREVFRKAKAAAPSVIFFDEIDAIAAKRGSSSGGSGVDDRVLTQLLTEMDGLEYLKDVFIMAATNRPDKIDRALLRPGRFDSLIYVPLPDEETRREILENKLKKMKTSDDVRIDFLVEVTNDYSGAEVTQLCQEAALTALRENIEATEVCHRHFETAVTKVLPQTDSDLLEIYHKFSSCS